MAWIDDRFWCHPKVTGLSDRAFRVFVNGITYSAGMGTRGHLNPSQIRLISARKREENELISAGLWDKNGNGVSIHDWDEHNEKRDERRAADRERKRLARAKERQEKKESSAGHGADSPQDAPQDKKRTSAGQAPDKHADRRTLTSEGSEGSEGKTPSPNPNRGLDASAGDFK